jgi:hypothetical protein
MPENDVVNSYIFQVNSSSVMRGLEARKVATSVTLWLVDSS